MPQGDRQRRAASGTERDLQIRGETLDQSVTPMVFGDDRFRVTYANRAFLDLFGIDDPGTLLGKPATEFQTRPTSAEAITDEMLARGSWVGEVTVTRADGSEVEVLIHASLLRNAEGTPLYSLATLFDITQRKRAERQLRLTQFSVDRCSTAIFWVRPDASFFYVNDAAARSFGYSRQELLSMRVHDIDPAYDEQVWPEYWRAMRKARTMTFESMIRHRDGRLVPVEVTTNVLDFEGQELLFAFLTDISERRRATHLASRLQTLLDRLRVGVFSCKPDGRFVELNEEMARLLAVDDPEQVGEHRLQSLFPEPSRADEFLLGVASSGQPDEVEIQGAGGSPLGGRTYRLHASPVLAEDQSLRIDGLLEDITHRKQAEAEARHAAVASAQIAMLTPRETEVLREVVAGTLNKVIARKLDISEKTVEKHRGNVMKKLGVRSVAELVRLAMLAEWGTEVGKSRRGDLP